MPLLKLIALCVKQIGGDTEMGRGNSQETVAQVIRCGNLVYTDREWRDSNEDQGCAGNGH